ncbi:MAG TPA: CBS domain-containing protein [Gemmatimonadaceae bacterium]|nr:CBS domain-containing protein [Gemmatimonadaceae bacterium]
MLKIREIMTTDVVSVAPQTPLQDVAELLAARHISGVPVRAGNRVVGVISATDIIDFAASTPGVPAAHEEGGDEPLTADTWTEGIDIPGTYFSELWEDAGAEVSERFDAVEGPEWNLLREHTAEEIMTRAVCALPPDTEVPAAAEYMYRSHVHRVLVMEHDTLVGIVSTMDIARAVAQRRLVARRFVFDHPSAFRRL